MPWRPRFHHLKHPSRRPPPKEPRSYFLASQWPKFPKVFLAVAIRKLGTEEHLAVGPARARYRAKRLRAVEHFRRRFGGGPAIEAYTSRRLYWESR